MRVFQQRLSRQPARRSAAEPDDAAQHDRARRRVRIYQSRAAPQVLPGLLRLGSRLGGRRLRHRAIKLLLSRPGGLASARVV